jgi:hypothetical protein
MTLCMSVPSELSCSASTGVKGRPEVPLQRNSAAIPDCFVDGRGSSDGLLWR